MRSPKGMTPDEWRDYFRSLFPEDFDPATFPAGTVARVLNKVASLNLPLEQAENETRRRLKELAQQQGGESPSMTATSTVSRQRGELRVVLERESSYALLSRVTVHGDDLYCGIHTSTKEELLRSTYHASGQGHIYVFDGAKRVLNSRRERLGDFKGCERLWAIGDPGDLEWSYQLKEGSNRTNFIVNIDNLRTPCTVDIWIIERGRVDLLTDIILLYQDHFMMRFVGFKLMDWTHPQVFAVAWKPSDEAIKSLEDFAKERGWPPGGKIGPMVTGPGPPKGPIHTISRDE